MNQIEKVRARFLVYARPVKNQPHENINKDGAFHTYEQAENVWKMIEPERDAFIRTYWDFFPRR